MGSETGRYVADWVGSWIVVILGACPISDSRVMVLHPVARPAAVKTTNAERNNFGFIINLRSLFQAHGGHNDASRPGNNSFDGLF